MLLDSPQYYAPIRPEEKIWKDIHSNATMIIENEPILKKKMEHVVLNNEDITVGIARIIAERFGEDAYFNLQFEEIFEEFAHYETNFHDFLTLDLCRVKEEDPACQSYFDAFLNFKGFHALQSYRLAHWLWREGRNRLAIYISNLVSKSFGIDIHPAARIGKGIILDHGTGIVIGETSIVSDCVTILQDVTLGGTGKESGDRHPKIGSGVKLWAGAKVLGNISIGDYTQVGASSVVLTDVPAHCTVVGIPARIVHRKL